MLLADLPYRFRLLVIALWLTGLGGLAVFIIPVVFGLGRADAPAFQALYVVILLVGAALCLARGALVERERASWLIFGAGAASFAAGYTYYFLVLQDLDSPPYPSPSDALWLTFYVGNVIALMLLLRARVTDFRRALWVDVGIAALALASIGAALLIDPILESTGASLTAVVVNLAYPLLDLLVISVVLAIFTLSGWRPGRDLVILGGALSILVVADVIYVQQVATAGYDSGTILDVSWPAVLLLIAAAAWTKPRAQGQLALEGWSMAAAPSFFAVVALVLTSYDHFSPINDVAFGLATVTLILAFVRTIVAFADVRTMSHAEDLLRTQSLILDSAGEGIYGIDLQGRTTFANTAVGNLTGYENDELCGQHLHHLIHHSHADGTPYPLADCPVHSALSDGAVHHITDEVYWRRDGSCFPVECTSTPIIDSGSVTGAVVVFRDVTERREIERTKDEFTSVVSHELRTPLTSIRGSLGLLAGGALGALPPKGQRMVDIAVANTDRLVRLINDILDIERINAGTVSMDRRDCQAVELVAQTAGVMGPVAEEAGITLKTATAPVALFADPDRIIQTLTNLVSNAIKFSPPGGEVSITCVRRGTDVLFRVTDQGRGVPADKLESIFERFRQVDASDSRDKGGTGLGLAICRSIVMQHGGDIWVESEPGRGSRFSFRLPAIAEPTDGAYENQDGPAVLVCDDDDDVREVICAILRQRGYRALPAASGAEALELARAEHPDVVLLDLLMPGLSGWDTAAALRLDPETDAIPIVIVSALAIDEAEPVGEGVAGWVGKPLDESSLIEVLDRVMAARDSDLRVLIVEDDEDLAGILRATLERHGLKTFHAATGERALELSDRVGPDLVVLDLTLPDIDGFAVVDWLRGDERLGRLPLVVYTARDIDDAERGRLRLGDQTVFFTKGQITPEQVEERILQLLGRITQHGEELVLDGAQASTGG